MKNKVHGQWITLQQEKMKRKKTRKIRKVANERKGDEKERTQRKQVLLESSIALGRHEVV